MTMPSETRPNSIAWHDWQPKSQIPVHLAIIPAHAEESLGPILAGGRFRGVVHGWSHDNHAPPEQKSSEFGTFRADAKADAERGLERLRELFGDMIHPMFVPPWNRIDPGIVPTLPGAGFKALSTYGPRRTALPAPGLTAINTHIDPVDWRGSRGLVDPRSILEGLTIHLRARRNKEADPAEPLGLLTHHLMMDDSTWDFCRALMIELRAGPVDIFDIATTGSIA